MDADLKPAVPALPFEIVELGNATRKWLLTLEPNYFELESPEGEVERVRRSEVAQRVSTFDHGLWLRRILAVKIEKKKVPFKLSPEAFAEASAWIGPPTVGHLKVALQQRFLWVLPLGVLFVVSALPFGDMPWEPVSLGLGVCLLVTGVIAKFFPHRSLFLIDAFWFLALAASTGWNLTQAWSWFQFVLLVFQLLAAQSGWTEFRRFANLRPDVELEE